MLFAAAKRFINRQGMDSAGILSFSTIFAFIPALALGLSIFSLSDYFAEYQPQLEQYLLQQVLPHNADQIKTYLLQFVNQAQKLQLKSFAFFVVTGSILLYEIDQRINMIWNHEPRRNWLSSIVSYLLVLFIGPILLGTSLIFSSYLLAMELFTPLAQSVIGPYLAAFLLSCLGLSLIYYLVPLCKVRYTNALIAGIFSAFLLEIVKVSIYSYYKSLVIWRLFMGHYPH